jgi:multiple sugar transport system permease protein
MSLPMVIYERAFGEYSMGYASAMSLAQFAILLVFTVAELRLMRPRWED